MDTLSVVKKRVSVKSEVRDLIDLAAESSGKNRTNFILDAARSAAEDVLLDQALMPVAPDAYAEFLNRLDQPPAPNPQLRKTMQSSAPWDA